MKELARDKFKTDAQYRKYLEYSAYWDYLSHLQNQGNLIYENGELIKGKFFSDENGFGIRKDGCRMYYVGSEWDENPKTGEYDLLWIQKALNTFKKECKFQMSKGFIDIN